MTSQAEQQAQQKLDELSLEFSAWRSSKIHARERIPAKLLEKARALSSEINSSTVRKRLSLSAQILQQTETSQPPGSPTTAPQFAEVSLPQQQDSPTQLPMRIEIHGPLGERIVLSNLSMTSPSAIVAKLLG
jgi:hypothetical protein